MKAKRLVILCGVFVAGLFASGGQAQNVTITHRSAPVQGEFCAMDRALLFQDPICVYAS